MKPRLQFGLRTLLVVTAAVAGVCAYGGRQAAIVHQRARVLSSIACLASMVNSDSDKSLPWIRRALGDHAHSQILVDNSVSESDFAAVKEAYPEAAVERSDLSVWAQLVNRAQRK